MGPEVQVYREKILKHVYDIRQCCPYCVLTERAAKLKVFSVLAVCPSKYKKY